MSQNFKGILYAVIATSLWGISGAFVQFLSQEKQIEASWLITCRMLFAGAILVLLAYFSKDKGVLEIWKDKPIRNRLIIFGYTGMFTVQFFFFKAIEHSNAATATILQFIGPVLISVYYSVVRKEIPSLKELMSLILAMMGIFLLVTHGDIHSLIISPTALLFGILSAIGLMVYTIQPIAIMKKYSAIVVVGWSMVISSTLAMIIHPIWNVSGVFDLPALGSIFFIVVFGTIVPFSLFLSALKIIGAQKGSLISCCEPLSAALIAVLWLGVQMILVDWLGAICIILTVFLLAKPPKKLVKQTI